MKRPGPKKSSRDTDKWKNERMNEPWITAKFKDLKFHDHDY
jgi:hypothetical protein